MLNGYILRSYRQSYKHINQTQKKDDDDDDDDDNKLYLAEEKQNPAWTTTIARLVLEPGADGRLITNAARACLVEDLLGYCLLIYPTIAEIQ